MQCRVCGLGTNGPLSSPVLCVQSLSAPRALCCTETDAAQRAKNISILDVFLLHTRTHAHTHTHNNNKQRHEDMKKLNS